MTTRPIDQPLRQFWQILPRQDIEDVFDPI